MKVIEADKIGSATSPLNLGKHIQVSETNHFPKAGDVVAVRALGESISYGNLELPSGRLAKINRGDVLLGVLGKRRALKGFVGDVPKHAEAGDQLHILNMGGVIGVCSGHHSSLTDAIQVELLGTAIDDAGRPLNISSKALQPSTSLKVSCPVIFIAGTCMNSGKTVAATEIIKQATHAGLKVAGAKLSGIACLRDTLNMEDHGAFVTASFIDCGLPSTVDHPDLPGVTKAILNYLEGFEPDLIVAELGDGIVGGYAVDSILRDYEVRKSISSFVFCASDYVGVIGGAAVLDGLGISIDVVAGGVTDSKMGEDFINSHFGLNAGNARRDGKRLFELVCPMPAAEPKVAAAK
jgi:hypothetical protein